MSQEIAYRGRDMKTIHRTKGIAGDLVITRQGETTTLWSSDGVRHTVFDRAAPHIPGLEYARNILAALAFCPDARSCLVLGLGGGSIPRMLRAASPQITVDAVEIDPAVVELADRYFDTRDAPGLRIYVEDAAEYVNCCSTRYDLIVLDTYVGEEFPARCNSPGFLLKIKDRMTDSGVLVINWLNDDGKLRKAFRAGLDAVFPHVFELTCMNSRNLLYFVTVRNVSRHDLLASAAAVQSRIPFTSSLAGIVHRLRR